MAFLLPPAPQLPGPLTLLTMPVRVQVAEVSLELRPNHDFLQRQRPRRVRADNCADGGCRPLPRARTG